MNARAIIEVENPKQFIKRHRIELKSKQHLLAPGTRVKLKSPTYARGLIGTITRYDHPGYLVDVNRGDIGLVYAWRHEMELTD
jgi:hypothetical protein